MQTGDDRLIALGDVSWTDYQITSEITLNAGDCVDFGEALFVGWTGHTYLTVFPALSPDQPRTGHPFFGEGAYGSLAYPDMNIALNIAANSPNYNEATLIQDTSGLILTPGVKYIMKLAVQRNPNNTSSQLFVKVWPATATEPASWNLQAQGDASTGAAMIGTFRADVSFGKITLAPFP